MLIEFYRVAFRSVFRSMHELHADLDAGSKKRTPRDGVHIGELVVRQYPDAELPRYPAYDEGENDRSLITKIRLFN